jgi:hypothetical protein
MKITSELLNYTMSNDGVFYVEDSEGDNIEPIYYVFFDDKNLDKDNAIKVDESKDGEVTIYTTNEHEFNNGLGFLVNICSTRDKECANMICEALNNLKEIYKQKQS